MTVMKKKQKNNFIRRYLIAINSLSLGTETAIKQFNKPSGKNIPQQF